MADLPEPVWPAEGQVVNPKPDSMYFRKDPYILTNFLVQFSRAHFSEPKDIVNEKYKEYIWTEDTTTSKILIEPSFKVNLQNTQQRPAILVKRDGIQVNPIGLGQGKHQSHFEPSGDRKEGRHVGMDFTTLISGTHSILCIGQSGGEADELGSEVFFKYLEYGWVLKKEANLGKFIVSGLMPVKKLDENKENWVSIINLTWTYDYSWTLYQEAPILKKIGIDSVGI
jgi:hypothetical protein